MSSPLSGFSRSRFPRTAGWLAAVLLCAVAVAAQTVPPDLLRQAARQSGLSEQELLQRYRQQAGAAALGDTLLPPGTTSLPGQAAASQPRVVLPFDKAPATPETVVVVHEQPEKPTASQQALFGADFFHLDGNLFSPTTYGPVPQDYLIGVGDQIVVDVWGEVEFRLERYVDRDGSIILPKGGRISCVNRTLAEVEQRVREALSRSYSGIDPRGDKGDTFVRVSLGNLRAIRVFVVGEARRPGAYELSSVATVLTALYAAGGPGDAGSLRDIRLVRGSETVAVLDLYDYLLSGRRQDDAILREGDTVFIPPRGATVQILGAVRRPMRYELRDGETVRDLIRYAGGLTADAVTGLVHVERIIPPERRRPNAPDREQIDWDLTAKRKYHLRDGDVVRVDRIPDRLENWVRVEGNVKRPGRYAWREGMTLADLVGLAGGPWDDTLFERALLDRIDPDGTYRAREVPLGDILAGKAAAPELQPRDVLRVLSRWDVQDRFQVGISGAVRRPGRFQWRAGMTLRDLILKAGGLAESADLLHAEVSRLSREAVTDRDTAVPPERTIDLIEVELGEDWLTDTGRFELQPHDQVAIRKLPWWQLPRTVVVQGEVMYPGVYTLQGPDERLSSVIARAGGLKPTAYVPGARLVRGKDDVGNVALDMGRALEKPGSTDDIFLEDGDRIIVPPVPYTVKVTGAVGFPTSIVWRKGLSLGDYVTRAGGWADQADKWKTHVVYPNGMSKPIRRIWNDPEVLPGSTIVVPVKRPQEGTTKLETMKEIASILASVATVWLVIDRTN